MEKYSLVLKNDRVKQYDTLALFIILINFAVLIYLLLYSPDRAIRIASLIGSVLITAALLIHFFLKRIKHNEGVPYLHGCFFILLLAWLQIGNYVIMGVIIVLQFLYQFAKKQVAIHIHENKIEYTAFPARTFTWGQLTNVMLKDGILTLDFKNNKVIQHEIVNSKWDVNEQEFNEFCRKHITPAIA